ncbi:hypothetical protein MAR_033445 [Mya arenaria]|uniref:LRAT domain-containing protein n=1 Tax=Mya arenaria TaxID=6604 RepID=A0ABY7G8Y8_MYAAR|nr:hypothetical protein MAR_033445 [Mya arenaria]
MGSECKKLDKDIRAKPFKTWTFVTISSTRCLKVLEFAPFIADPTRGPNVKNYQKVGTWDDKINLNEAFGIYEKLFKLITNIHQGIDDVKPADATQLKRGQHISVPGGVRLCGRCPYRHHAIIVEVKKNPSPGKATLVVIHTPDKHHDHGERIQREEQVYDLDTILIRQYATSEYTLEDVAENAEKQRKTNREAQYNLCHLNCEHFCTECAIGILRSCQVLTATVLIQIYQSLVVDIYKIVKLCTSYEEEHGWKMAAIMWAFFLFPFLLIKKLGGSLSNLLWDVFAEAGRHTAITML